MDRKQQDVITFLERNLATVPDFIDIAGSRVWEISFCARQGALRQLVGEAIVLSGDGSYVGDVGNHSLFLGELTVYSDDGYQALIEAWLNVAKAGAA